MVLQYTTFRISEAAEEPYPVRFDALGVLVVLAETSEEANFCTNGPMDMISVKICATVVDMPVSIFWIEENRFMPVPPLYLQSGVEPASQAVLSELTTMNLASRLHMEEGSDRIHTYEKPLDRNKGMSTSIIPTLHLARVYEKLIAFYGEPKNEPDYDPLGGLIATILSQHTSDFNSGRAYQQLRDTFATWETVRDAPTNKVAEAIKSGGLANIKSVRIQDVLQTLTEQQEEQEGTKTLAEYLSDELTKRSTEEGWSYLRSLPGVGPKTAACVLMFHLDRAAFPIDTHVWRILRRLGLIGPKVSADQAHVLFAKVTPHEWVYPLHVNLITHGRRVCHAQRPECNRCTLYSECAFVGSVNAQETAIPAR